MQLGKACFLMHFKGVSSQEDFMKLILTLAILFGSLLVNAQTDPYDRARIDRLERAVNRLESLASSLERRITDLERNNGGSPWPSPQPPPVENAVSCLVVDTGFLRTFLGKGRTSVQAEVEAKKSCEKSVNASYCNGKVKCAQMDRMYSGFTCVVTDTGFGRTFSSDGRDAVEAEAKAKMDCQSKVNPSYCGNAPVRCEGYR